MSDKQTTTSTAVLEPGVTVFPSTLTLLSACQNDTIQLNHAGVLQSVDGDTAVVSWGYHGRTRVAVGDLTTTVPTGEFKIARGASVYPHPEQELRTSCGHEVIPSTVAGVVVRAFCLDDLTVHFGDHYGTVSHVSYTQLVSLPSTAPAASAE